MILSDVMSWWMNGNIVLEAVHLRCSQNSDAFKQDMLGESSPCVPTNAQTYLLIWAMTRGGHRGQTILCSSTWTQHPKAVFFWEFLLASGCELSPTQLARIFVDRIDAAAL